MIMAIAQPKGFKYPTKSKTYASKVAAQTAPDNRAVVGLSSLAIVELNSQKAGRLFMAQTIVNTNGLVEGHVFRSGEVAMFFHSTHPEVIQGALRALEKVRKQLLFSTLGVQK